MVAVCLVGIVWGIASEQWKFVAVMGGGVWAVLTIWAWAHHALTQMEAEWDRQLAELSDEGIQYPCHACEMPVRLCIPTDEACCSACHHGGSMRHRSFGPEP